MGRKRNIQSCYSEVSDRWVSEYIKIWEDHYGPVPFDENGRRCDIHHKDFDTWNTSIDNLVCLTHSEHLRLHNLNSKRSEETKEKLKEKHWTKGDKREQVLDKIRQAATGVKASEESKNKRMMNDPRSIKIICVETGEVFYSVNQAKKIYGYTVNDQIYRNKKRNPKHYTFMRV